MRKETKFSILAVILGATLAGAAIFFLAQDWYRDTRSFPQVATTIIARYPDASAQAPAQNSPLAGGYSEPKARDSASSSPAVVGYPAPPIELTGPPAPVGTASSMQAPVPNPPDAPAQAHVANPPIVTALPAPASVPNPPAGAYPNPPAPVPARSPLATAGYATPVPSVPAPTASAPFVIAEGAVKQDDADASCRQHMLTLGVVLAATDPCVDLDTLIKNLQVGTYSFNQPPSAYVEEPFTVVLTLETAAGQDVSKAFQGTPGARKTEQGKWAQHLEATLHGLDFKIDPPGPQEQIATEGSPVQWRWTVSAQSAGKKNLDIDVNAILTVGPAKNRFSIRTLEDEIQVNVTYSQMIISAFTGLWGLLLGVATMVIAGLSVLHYWPLKGKTDHGGESEEPPPVELIAHQHVHSPHSSES